MDRPSVTSTRLMMLIAVVVLLSACTNAARPQAVAKDDADRLFLKLADIAQQPSPAKPDDLVQVADLIDRLPTSGNDCMSKNSLILFEVRNIFDHDLDNDNPANWAQKSADMRKRLQYLQTAPMMDDKCAGRAFPQDAI